MDSGFVEEFNNLHLTSKLGTENNLIDSETDLSKVLEVSYISKTHRELLELLLGTHDGHNPNKRVSNSGGSNFNLCEELDKFRDQIIGPTPWKSQLEDKHKEMTHYQEFLAFRVGGCTAERKLKPNHSKRCDECYMHSTLEDNPSSLIRFIRNLHAHAVEKMSKHPGGVIETYLFPNGYEDKRQFVDYWMNKFPKLFHINAALRTNQIHCLDWSSDSVPDQVLEGLNKAINYERDHGSIIDKYECEKLDDGSKCKLEILISDVKTLSRNNGKTLVVVDSTLTVIHGSADIVTYTLHNPRSNQYNITFGLEHLNSVSIRSKYVVLVINQFQSVGEVAKRLQEFGCFHHVPIKWSDISGHTQRHLLSNGTLQVQNQIYPAGKFSLQNLSGVQLNEFLKTGNLQLFKQVARQPTYVQRWFIRPRPCFQQDAIFFVSDPLKMWEMEWDSKCIYTDQELCSLQIGYYKFFVLQYKACLETTYYNIMNLALGKKAYLLEFGPNAFLTEKGMSREGLVELIPQNELFRKEPANLVFISGGAGAGKTSYIQNMFESLYVLDTVVVQTYAPDLVSRFKGNFDTPVTQTLAKCCGFTNLEADVVKQLNVVLLMDALDEVDCKKLKHANNLIRYFLSSESVRLVVSLRTYLVNELHKFPPHQLYTLADMNRAGKISICMSFWKSLNKREKPNESTAEQIVSTYQKLLKLTPLECEILADIHTEEAFNQTMDKRDFQAMDEIEMYKAVVKKNFYRYLTCKKNVAEKNVEDDMYARLEDEYKLAHVYLAIKFLIDFNLDSLKGPLEHPNVRLAPGQGFLDNIDPVKFAHKNIAEFFVDSWVFDVLSGEVNIKRKYVTAFSEMFCARYLGILQTNFLEKMLKDYKEPLYFPFDMEVFDLAEIAKLSLHIEQSFIFKTLITSFDHYSSEIFRERLSAIKLSEFSVTYATLRPYNGSGPEQDIVSYVAMQPDFLIKWLCMGERPSDLLHKCPNGFYLESTTDETIPINDSPCFIKFKLVYIPDGSIFAKNQGFPMISREHIMSPIDDIGIDSENRKQILREISSKLGIEVWERSFPGP